MNLAVVNPSAQFAGKAIQVLRGQVPRTRGDNPYRMGTAEWRVFERLRDPLSARAGGKLYANMDDFLGELDREP